MIEFWFSTVETLGLNSLNTPKCVRFKLSRAISIWIRVNSQQCSVPIPKRISNNTQFDGYLNSSNRTETISAQVIVSRDELVRNIFVNWKNLDLTTMNGTVVIGDNLDGTHRSCKLCRFTSCRSLMTIDERYWLHSQQNNDLYTTSNCEKKCMCLACVGLLLSSADSDRPIGVSGQNGVRN